MHAIIPIVHHLLRTGRFSVRVAARRTKNAALKQFSIRFICIYMVFVCRSLGLTHQTVRRHAAGTMEDDTKYGPEIAYNFRSKL